MKCIFHFRLEAASLPGMTTPDAEVRLGVDEWVR